ncbi:DUF2254 domain-containing protein [Corynebacterium sp. TAE3-ERU12]|uniref:DUF2254 domain-containing protein n=1 Tax=Corynebacterium sp. TAE3-ERU12 TaxID=2849491 RepID=UPI001C495594|nr:DUF2254 domain-containing protein [Corynebacterium sp. TAE3-ERU12]MBV7295459.1 DUF2254 domain-containing protein [Corynebacterium sp. TAE3-ERU12]
MKMQTWLRRMQRKGLAALESFWFIPSLCIVLAMLLASVLVQVDRSNSFESVTEGLLELGVSGSRSMLSGIGATVFGVAGTAFSITISVVATASTSYGPRLVRNFMADRGNQVVLGVLSATFVYSLLVLRTIRAGNEESGGDFVPHVAVYFAIFLAVADVFVLVYFINHIATSIRVETLSRATRLTFVDTVKRVFHERDEDSADAAAAETTAVPPFRPPHSEQVTRPSGGVRKLYANSTGYVTSVDGSTLRDAAAKNDAVIELSVGVGSPVAPGEVVARVWRNGDSTQPLSDDVVSALDTALRHATDVEDSRNPYRDVAFAEQQVVELAVRALSPGSNDPYTAMGAIDELVPGLILAVQRQAPPQLLADDDGVIRASIPRVSAADVIDQPFTHIVPYSMEQPLVLEAMVEMATRVMPHICEPGLAVRLRGHVATMIDQAESHGAQASDITRLRAAAKSLPDAE